MIRKFDKALEVTGIDFNRYVTHLQKNSSVEGGRTRQGEVGRWRQVERKEGHLRN